MQCFWKGKKNEATVLLFSCHFRTRSNFSCFSGYNYICTGISLGNLFWKPTFRICHQFEDMFLAAGPAILITDSDDDCAPRQRPNSSGKESSPRVLKRKRSSSDKLNEDENGVPNTRMGQDQERALEVGGSSINPDPATVTSATNNPEYKNTVARNGQGVLGPLKANPAPEMKALSPHYAKCFEDEFKEFLTSSSSDSDSEW